MDRSHARRTSDRTDADERSLDADSISGSRSESPATTGPAVPTTATVAATQTPSSDDHPHPNTLTIIGGGSPSSFEITVDGEIELAPGDRDADATVVSGSTVEGTIETGTIRFGFTGELADVTFVDRRITGLSPTAAPNVHVDYSAPKQQQS